MGGKSTSTQTEHMEPYSGKAYDYVWGPLYEKVINRLNDSQGYTGPLNVGQSADQTNAYNNLANAANNNTYMQQTASGAFVDPSNNPYYQKTLDMNSRVVRDLMEKGFNTANASAASHGIYNSSMRRNMLDNQVKAAGQQLSDMATQLGSNFYNTGTTNALNAYNAQNSAYGNVLNAASGLQNQAQGNLDRERQEYWQRVGQQDQNVQTGLAFANTIKNPTTEQTATQSTSDPLSVFNVLNPLSNAMKYTPSTGGKYSFMGK